MAFWVILWKTVFIVTVTLFGIMAVWVTFQGARDIKDLLTALRERHKTDDSH